MFDFVAKMKTFYYFLVAFEIFNPVLSENDFFKKLENLVDYCWIHQENFDQGTLLGVSIAKQQLSSEPLNKITENLLEKCENLEERFFTKNRRKFHGSNEIGSFYK